MQAEFASSRESLAGDDLYGPSFFGNITFRMEFQEFTSHQEPKFLKH